MPRVSEAYFIYLKAFTRITRVFLEFLNTDIISAVCVAFFWVVNESRNEKSCLQFLIPTAIFHMLLIIKVYFRTHTNTSNKKTIS